jgi:hypothetical protein
MKKFLLFAVMLLTATAMFTGCKQAVDPNEARISQVKKDIQGTWEGRTTSLVGEGDYVQITFTENKISAVFEDETVNLNILAWHCIDGKDVWMDLDDDMKTHLTVKSLEGDNMITGTDSSFGLNIFPMELTRVKK